MISLAGDISDSKGQVESNGMIRGSSIVKHMLKNGNGRYLPKKPEPFQ